MKMVCSGLNYGGELLNDDTGSLVFCFSCREPFLFEAVVFLVLYRFSL